MSCCLYVMESMKLLFTLDKNYLPQLHVVLTSLRFNNPGESFDIYLMHRGLQDEDLETIKRRCQAYDWQFKAITVDETLFAHAPVSKQYPQEMYYRMLAPHLLPADVERVLYLDPDILVINPLRPLWETDLDGCLFAAAAHTGKTELVSSVNRVRLNVEHDYFNSGVLLIDCKAGRRAIEPQVLFDFTAAHGKQLILPDQDLLNQLFGTQVQPVEDTLWNYDHRDYHGYYLTSGGCMDADWVMSNTAILHFCGKAKPWKSNYRYRFGILYKHYQQLTRHEVTALLGV